MVKKIPPELRGKRFNSISDCLKDEFGKKTIKLSIDGGFTCPNRDGSKGRGGCTFCSDTGSGEFSSDIDTQIGLLSDKWPDAAYLAYFQNHTNTYAPVDELRERMGEIERGKPVYVMCQSGIRSYIACRILAQEGFDCYNFSGGYRFYAAVTQEKRVSESAYPCGMER